MDPTRAAWATSCSASLGLTGVMVLIALAAGAVFAGILFLVALAESDSAGSVPRYSCATVVTVFSDV